MDTLSKNVVASSAPSKVKLFRSLLTPETGSFSAIVLLVIVLSILSPRFLLLNNLFNVLRQISLLAIIAIGMLHVIVCGEIDLSVGSTFGLVAVSTSMLIVAGCNYWLALFVGLSIGTLIGMLNGVLVAKVGIPSFVATLGFMSIGRGIAQTLTQGWPVTIYGTDVPKWFLYIGGGRIFDLIPMQAVFMAVLLVIGYFLLHKSRTGYHIYAVGGNSRAARLYGIGVEKIKIFSFALTGFLSALAGILALSFIQSAETNMGASLELDVIAVAVIGGASLQGGRGSILGVLLGAMTIGILLNGLVLLKVSPFIQRIVIGSVIILAVIVSERVAKVRE